MQDKEILIELLLNNWQRDNLTFFNTLDENQKTIMRDYAIRIVSSYLRAAKRGK